MNHLFRELPPVSAAAWREIDKEATRTLKTTLAARRLVDFVGPLGWAAAAVGTGRCEPIKTPPVNGAEARRRNILPLVKLRVPFEMRRSELDAIDRGAKDPDTDPIIAAARKIAIAEDRAVFHGYPAAGIRGICEARAAAALELSDDFTADPEFVVTASTKQRVRLHLEESFTFWLLSPQAAVPLAPTARRASKAPTQRRRKASN